MAERAVTGHVQQRTKGPRGASVPWPGHYRLVADLGYDPVTHKRRRPVRYFTGTEKQAKAELRRWLSQLEFGVNVDPDKVTVREWMDRWVREWAPRRERSRGDAPTRVAGATINDYSEMVDRYINVRLGDVQLQRLTPLMLDRFFGELLETGGRGGGGLSGSTTRQVYATLSRALKRAVREKVLKSNPLDDVAKPSKHDGSKALREPVALERAELLDFIATAQGNRILPAIVLGGLIGLRQSEALALRWSDVDVVTGTVRVRHAWKEKAGGGYELGDPKSRKSKRAVPIAAATVDALKLLKEECGGADGDYIVPMNRSGKAWMPGSFASAYRGARKRLAAAVALERNNKAPAWADATYHDLRHSAGSIWLRDGVPLTVVSEWLGHSGVGITGDIYLHTLQSLETAARDLCERGIRYDLSVQGQSSILGDTLGDTSAPGRSK